MQQKTGQNYIFVDFTVQFRRVKNMRQFIELLHLSKIVHNFYQTSIIGTLNQKHKGKRVIKNHYQINDKLIEPKILNNHDLQKTQNQNVYVENYKYIHNGTIREKFLFFIFRHQTHGSCWFTGCFCIVSIQFYFIENSLVL